MARPIRCRRICFEPEFDKFAPCGVADNGQVILSVDEFEAIRLIDYEKMTHERCASQMDISRTTVTEIYERARGKIADSLVNGRMLYISGGSYSICTGHALKRCERRCKRADCEIKAMENEKENIMKVAVTYENGYVFPHFGHTEQFKLYTIEDGKIVDSKVVDTNGSGHGALAGFLQESGVDTLICGGIGGGAQMALAAAGIRLYGGVSGEADAAVDALLSGSLAFDPDVHCNHHDGEHHCHGHHEHGYCGEDKHGCGGNSCGC